MRRVAVIGGVGAGKSTLARDLGQRLGIRVVHLDRLWWKPGPYRISGPETAADHALTAEEFRAVQERLVAEDEWVIDGPREHLEVRLTRADTVVFVDRSRWVCLWHLIRRHNRPREDYPRGVTESVRWFWRLAWWVWSYPTKKRPWFEHQLALHAANATVYQLQTRADVRAFLTIVEPDQPTETHEHQAAMRRTHARSRRNQGQTRPCPEGLPGHRPQP